jgi:spermidine synthase
MVLVVDVFIPIFRILGRLMNDHPNTIWAYSINIIGSLVGTWLFVILSINFLPPIAWFIVFSLMMAIFILWTRDKWRVNISLLIAVIILSWFAGKAPGAIKIIWSPYQKLTVSGSDRNSFGFGNLVVSVNNTIYQMIADLRENHISSDLELYPPEIHSSSQYDIPLLLHPNPHSYLIVGAGAGNDVAGGLRQGVKQINAIEIDPAIIDIGKSYHPEKPYSSAGVQVVIDDARSFFATTSQKYDVISFGLLDSHTTTSMTNARLDSYVYTEESIQRAKSLLADGGVLVLTFEAQKLFIADRMERVLEVVFGEAPIYFRIPPSAYSWGGVMFIAGDLDTARQQILINPQLDNYIRTLQEVTPISLPNNTRITTDNWPYIYLESPKNPGIIFPKSWINYPNPCQESSKMASRGYFFSVELLSLAFLFLGGCFSFIRSTKY